MRSPHPTPARLDLADPATLRQLWHLQRAAYTRLIGFDGIPPLHETLQELRSCRESFLGIQDAAALIGAIAWTRLADATLDICRLVVHPRAHRQGVATALLTALDDLEPADRTVVSTGTANLPALDLYHKHGFQPVGERPIADGITVTRLERTSPPTSQPTHNN